MGNCTERPRETPFAIGYSSEAISRGEDGLQRGSTTIAWRSIGNNEITVQDLKSSKSVVTFEGCSVSPTGNLTNRLAHE